MSEENDNCIKVATARVELPEGDLSVMEQRPGVVARLTVEESTGREAAGEVIPMSEVAANRHENRREAEVEREVVVYIAENEVNGETFTRNDFPAHIPFVSMMVPIESTFALGDESDLLPGEGEDALPEEVIMLPSAPCQYLELGSATVPGMIGIRGTIMSVYPDKDTGKEEVDVFVQLYPFTDEVHHLFKVGVKVQPSGGDLSEEERGRAEDERTVVRVLLESLCNSLTDLFPRGMVQVGATFEIYFARTSIDGHCTMVVHDLRLNGNPNLVFRNSDLADDPLVTAGPSVRKRVGRFLDRRKPDPWPSFDGDSELLSVAEAILYGFTPAIDIIWNRLFGQHPEVLTQIMRQPIARRPPPNAQLERPKGVPVGGRFLLRDYDGPSLFSDIPKEN